MQFAGGGVRNAGRRLWVAAAILAAPLTFSAGVGARASSDEPVYKNPHAPVEQRVEDLLARMTLEEKIAQITTVWQVKNELLTTSGAFDSDEASRRFPAGIGHLARPSDLPGNPYRTPYRDEGSTVALVNAVQKHVLEKTRLGIPVLFHEEGLHGYSALGATHFPQSIALASSWEPELLERVFTVVAREIRARGAHMVLGPIVDVARDPRWGRIEETYGEDPYLVSQLGVAAVRGFQGDSLPLESGRVLATLKHMTGHGQPQSGTNVGPANISERVLREIFFPPFRAAIQSGGAQAVMASYNEIDGLPSHANRWLLQDVLRGEMGFEGAVVSDYWAIKELANIHKVEPDLVSAAARALRAGVDFDLPDGDAYVKLPEALEKGWISEADIDNAVRRMLRLKFLAGLFENPYADASYAESITDNAEARALALEAARKSVVLLKNNKTLPLSAAIKQTIAVIGPHAEQVDLGGYSNVPAYTVSLLEGIRSKVGSGAQVVAAEGVRIVKEGNWYDDKVVLADPAENRRRIREAVKVARGADVVVLAIGGSSAVFREGWGANHLGDRLRLDLIGEQRELAEAIFALGKPVIVTLFNGQPLSIPDIVEKADAVVEGWYLGQEAGRAMADILFGDFNPGGKLPVTVARSVGQLPIFYNRKPSARRGYHEGTTEPLFPFGFGLSYTSFELGAPVLSSPRIKAGEKVQVSVEVRNTGDYAGDEVVQLYVRDQVSSVTRPVKELKGFRRVSLEAGAATKVNFELSRDEFAYWGEGMKYRVEPGDFSIMVGADSVNLKSATLTVEP